MWQRLVRFIRGLLRGGMWRQLSHDALAAYRSGDSWKLGEAFAALSDALEED